MGPKKWFVMFSALALLAGGASRSLGVVSIGGRVLDAGTREPVASATVRISPGQVLTGTDLDGTFSFGQQEAGDYVLTVTAEGYQALTLDLSLADGQDVDLELLLEVPPTTGSIAVSVTTAELPFASVLVRLDDASGDFDDLLDATFTGASGTVLFEELAPGPYTVISYEYGFGIYTRSCAVVAAETCVVEFAMEPVPTGTIAGVVVGAEGTPVPGALVESEWRFRLGSVAVLTDETGSFALEVPRGQHFVWAFGDGGEVWLGGANVKGGATSTVSPVLEVVPPERSQWIGLASFEWTELPVPRATITITDGDFTASARTNEDGLYRFPDLPPGTYSYEIRSSRSRATNSGVELTGGQVLDRTHRLLGFEIIEEGAKASDWEKIYGGCFLEALGF